MQLEHGKTYRTRDGRVVDIIRWTDQNNGYPFSSPDGTEVYTVQGEVMSDKYSTGDLVEEVKGFPVMGTGSNVLTVLSEVLAERQRQDVKWGPQNHGPMIWLGILAEEFGEAAKDANDFHFASDAFVKSTKGANFRKELVQVAAVAVAMIESYDRNEGK